MERGRLYVREHSPQTAEIDAFIQQAKYMWHLLCVCWLDIMELNSTRLREVVEVEDYFLSVSCVCVCCATEAQLV